MGRVLPSDRSDLKRENDLDAQSGMDSHRARKGRGIKAVERKKKEKREENKVMMAMTAVKEELK